LALLSLRKEVLKHLEHFDEESLYDLFCLDPLIASYPKEKQSSETYTDGLISPEALYTSFSDYHIIYQDFRQRGLNTFCDLGGGIGKGKLLFDALSSSQPNPPRSYSFELIPERSERGLFAHQKLKFSFPEGFINGDLLVEPLPSCQSYFIYLPVGSALDSILDKLEELCLHSTAILYVIESHGDLISYLRKSLPLSLLKKHSLKGTRHNPYLHIFEISNLHSFRNAKKSLLKKAEKLLTKKAGLNLRALSEGQTFLLFKGLEKNKENLQFVVREEENKTWLASVEGWRHSITPGAIETQIPFRIVKIKQIDAVLIPQGEWLKIIKLRAQQCIDGFKPQIRKIILKPHAMLEFSNGNTEDLSLVWDTLGFPEIESELLLQGF